MARQKIISDQDWQYLDKLLDVSFIKEALSQIVYEKLFSDGYVYCKDGLFLENKENLKQQLQADSILSDVIKGSNPTSFIAACECLSGIDWDTQKDKVLTKAEYQAILYILLAPVAKDTYPKILLHTLQYLYPNLSDFLADKSFIFRKNIELTSISSVEELISSIRKISETKNRFFRGHSNVNYISVPSLFREPRLYKNEYIMYQELVVRCPDAFIQCTSHLDFLVEMQHYGLPTRLLDVTLNPLIALYFACENGDAPGEILLYEVTNNALKYEKCDEVAILSCLPMLTFSKQKDLLNILKDTEQQSSPVYEEFRHEVLSERPSFHGKISLNKVVNPTFVKPIRRNQRIAHQEGAFILWGLDENFYSSNPPTINNGQNIKEFRHISNGKTMVFYIPAAKKKEILQVLNQLGINRAYVYPEIDDVAEYIKADIK